MCVHTGRAVYARYEFGQMINNIMTQNAGFFISDLSEHQPHQGVHGDWADCCPAEPGEPVRKSL